MTAKSSQGVSAVFEPDEVRAVLRDKFFASDTRASTASTRAPKKVKPKPEHYEVICISMYREDLDRLDAKVQELKERGHRKMNRSALIRFALDQVDATKLPRSY